MQYGSSKPASRPRAVLSPLLSLAGLLLVGFLFLSWAPILADSAQDYRSLIREELVAGEPLPGLADRVVLVIIDRLSPRAIWAIGWLMEPPAGAGFAPIADRDIPTWGTAWASLLSGAPHPFSGGAPLAANSLIHVLIQADFPFAIAGHLQAGDRFALLGEESTSSPFSWHGTNQEVAQAAIDIWDQGDSSLLLIHLDGSEDMPGEDWDGILHRIAGRMDLARQGLVIVALQEPGRLGGTISGLLVAQGRGIATVDAGAMHLTDLAPTIAVLAGTPLPPLTSGHVVSNLFNWDADMESLVWVSLAQQRAVLADSYLRGLGVISPAGLSEETNGQLLSRLYPEEAKAIVSNRDALMEGARAARLAGDRLARAWMAPASGLVFALGLWRLLRKGQISALAPALATLFLFHPFYLLFGGTYWTGGFEETERVFLRAGLAGSAGFFLPWLFGMFRRRKEEGFDALSAFRHTIRQGWLTVGLWLPAIALLSWWAGPTVTWTMAAPSASFILYLTLLAAGFSALGGFALAWVATPAIWLIGWVRKARKASSFHHPPGG